MIDRTKIGDVNLFMIRFFLELAFVFGNEVNTRFSKKKSFVSHTTAARRNFADGKAYSFDISVLRSSRQSSPFFSSHHQNKIRSFFSCSLWIGLTFEFFFLHRPSLWIKWYIWIQHYLATYARVSIY